MAKYKIIPSSRNIVQSPISIGHKAEKGVEAIEFDLTAWVETYGSGTLTVIMRRWGDAIPYPIALEIDENNKATWVLSDTDTAKAGMAYAQLSYIVGDEVVKKSDIYTFRVTDSLTGDGEPPEAYESWLETLTHLAAEAMAEVLDIEGVVTDKTLTVDGGIADAKATGEALAEKVDAADYSALSDRVGRNTIALAEKADRSTTYTKTQVDQMIEDVEVETDTTLEVAGAAADAKKVGDELSDIKADLADDYSCHWGLGYTNATGGISPPGAEIALVTELIPVKKGMKFALNMTQSATPSSNKWVAIAEYADDYTLSTSRVFFNVPAATTPYNYEYTVSGENTKYIRFSYRSYGGIVKMTITRAVNASAYALEDSYKYTAFNDYNIADMFEVGSWDYANSRFTEEELKYRVKSKDWLTVENPTAFAVPTTFKLTAYYIAPNSNTVSSIASVYSAFIPAGSKVRLTIKRNTEDTSEVLTDISEFTSVLTVTDAVYRLGDVVGGLAETTGYLSTIADQSFVRGINHRGWHECPENTLIAFKTSRLKGFKWVECDIQFTSDSIPVILHDGYINRTARNSDGSELTDNIRIGDITYAQANAYDYGIYKGAEFAGTKLPTFEEFISLCKRVGLRACIEVKDNSKIRDTANVQKIVDIVKKYNMDDYVIWFGSKVNISNVVAYKPSAKVGIQTSDVDATTISDILSLKTSENAVFAFANIVNLTDAQIDDCMSNDIGVIAWTLDTRSAILNANKYISGIASNLLNAPAVIYRDEMINVN